jgi:hypothetical protein
MKKHSDVHHAIAKLLTIPDADSIIQSHQWRHEGDREHELIFALLTRVISLPESDVRVIAHRLRLVGLLDLDEWVDLPGTSQDERDVLERRTLDILSESGVDDGEATRAVGAIREVAAALQRKYDSKVQRLLREHGNQLVNSLVKDFDMKSLSKTEAREAVAYWLQNVASLPIMIGRDSTKRFCELHGTTVDELIRASDDFNLNVAALDDLIHGWITSGEKDGRH